MQVEYVDVMFCMREGMVYDNGEQKGAWAESGYAVWGARRERSRRESACWQSAGAPSSPAERPPPHLGHRLGGASDESCRPWLNSFFHSSRRTASA